MEYVKFFLKNSVIIRLVTLYILEEIMGTYHRSVVTINDVAREAGVSITTVSRVLNNNYPVKKETREKIESAIERLNYNPNTIARGLIMKKTSVIGIVVPGITNLFFPTIVEAIDEIIRREGYSISLNSSGGNPVEERNLVSKLVSMQVDGIIVIDPTAENIDNGFYEGIDSKLPLIIVNAKSTRDKLNFVSYDEEIGTREAFEYLSELGHKAIAFLRGGKSFSYDIKERIYFAFIDEKGLKYKEVVEIKNGNSIDAVDEAEVAVETLLKSDKKPSAIFACNDLMAIGALNACNNIGLNVPKDLSIIGFDNTLVSKITHPKLTTVDMSMNRVGERAALEIIKLIEVETGEKVRAVIETRLLVRDSCSENSNAL